MSTLSLPGTFKQLVDINFACAMGPPGGGRNPITQRLTRHFNCLSFTEMEDSSKRKIFSTILGSWMGELGTFLEYLIQYIVLYIDNKVPQGRFCDLISSTIV